jgi:hypothetical protein
MTKITGFDASSDNAREPECILEFSGYVWNIRQAGRGGPGPNEWDPANAWVDENGHLHLRLTRKNATWHCAEVFTTQRFGFGQYRFQVTGRLDRLDRNAVLGLFNYPTPDVGPDGTHEIDIEFAKWGNALSPIGNFTVWSTIRHVAQVTHSVPYPFDGEFSTHSFSRTPESVSFQSFGESRDGRLESVASWEYRPRNPQPWISVEPMPVHLNLWCFRGMGPSNGDGIEIVFRSFSHTPAASAT